MGRCLGTLRTPRHFWHPTNSLTRLAYMNARMRSAICCRHRGHVLTASAHSEHTHTCPHGRSSVVRCAFMQITHSLLTLLTLPRVSAAPSAARLPSLPVSLPLGGWREDSGSYTGGGRAGGCLVLRGLVFVVWVWCCVVCWCVGWVWVWVIRT